ncbi:MAG: PhnD/SsuA/transferrin family substrate-binding protein [Candidatus Schekmanbacteria bacterium]|nr:PhnD/SsuA/transferrin family substrate-binding protein [Candidatus Schekmanbacteria bacterium]
MRSPLRPGSALHPAAAWAWQVVLCVLILATAASATEGNLPRISFLYYNPSTPSGIRQHVGIASLVGLGTAAGCCFAVLDQRRDLADLHRGLTAALERGLPAVVSGPPHAILALRQQYGLSPLCSAARDGSPLESLKIVGSRADPRPWPEGFRGSRAAWYDEAVSVTVQRGLLAGENARTFFGEVRTVTDGPSAVTAIFFRIADVAIVGDGTIVRALRETSPGVWRQTAVLGETLSGHIHVIYALPTLIPAVAARFRDVLVDADGGELGRAALRSFWVDEIVPLTLRDVWKHDLPLLVHARSVAISDQWIDFSGWLDETAPKPASQEPPPTGPAIDIVLTDPESTLADPMELVEGWLLMGEYLASRGIARPRVRFALLREAGAITTLQLAEANRITLLAGSAELTSRARADASPDANVQELEPHYEGGSAYMIVRSASPGARDAPVGSGAERVARAAVFAAEPQMARLLSKGAAIVPAETPLDAVIACLRGIADAAVIPERFAQGLASRAPAIFTRLERGGTAPATSPLRWPLIAARPYAAAARRVAQALAQAEDAPAGRAALQRLGITRLVDPAMRRKQPVATSAPLPR